MAMTPEQRQRWDLQVAALRSEESFDRGTEEQRKAMLDAANRWRHEHGIAPLKDEFEDADELGFHERALALGLRRPLR